MKYIVPSTEEMQAWVTRVRAEVWPEAEKSLGKDLMDQIRALGRPDLLAFFGDHRPSIPGVSMPGGPATILRASDSAAVDPENAGSPPSISYRTRPSA